MRKRFLGMSLAGALVLLVILSSALVAQRRPGRPASGAAPGPARSDLKITYRQTTSGQSMETTTMLKGQRERSEMKMGHGMDIINITQCDLKRTVQISDSTRKYVVTPMDTADSTAGSGAAAATTVAEPSRRGGLITYTSTAVDTGERKEMFGFQARHVKTSMVIESSPDACSPVKQRMDTDGWYIDFSFGLNCERGAGSMMSGPSPRGGCRDRVRFNRQGAARTGYALQETMTSYGPDGRVVFTSTKEVVELSREPLDAALFDVPAGYTETQNTQELYGMPSMAAMTSQAASGREDDLDKALVPQSAKAAGGIRIGVVQVNNRTDRAVSQDALRARLLAEIRENGLEAVPLNAISPGEAQTEAKAKQCDFILYTDIAALKTSAAKKLGGMFGRATGVGSGGIDKTEAKIEFQLFAVGETAPRLKSAATAKEEGDEASAGTALEQEANQVSAAARKKS
jgi:hypothetical protein